MATYAPRSETVVAARDGWFVCFPTEQAGFGNKATGPIRVKLMDGQEDSWLNPFTDAVAWREFMLTVANWANVETDRVPSSDDAFAHYAEAMRLLRLWACPWITSHNRDAYATGFLATLRFIQNNPAHKLRFMRWLVHRDGADPANRVICEQTAPAS